MAGTPCGRDQARLWRLYPGLVHNYEIYSPRAIAGAKAWVRDTLGVPALSADAPLASLRLWDWYLALAGRLHPSLRPAGAAPWRWLLAAGFNLALFAALTLFFSFRARVGAAGRRAPGMGVHLHPAVEAELLDAVVLNNPESDDLSPELKQQREGLLPEEGATEAALLRQYERHVLVRSEALVLLKQRGATIPAPNQLPTAS